MSNPDLNKNPKVQLNKSEPVQLDKPVARFDPETGLPLGQPASGAPEKQRFPIGCIAGFLVIPIIIACGVIYLLHYIKENEIEEVSYVTTPSGDVEIPKEDYEAFYDAVDSNDIEAMKAQLDKHPELIYIQGAIYPMFDQVVLHSTPEGVRVMLDHGAKPDDPFCYEPRHFSEYTFRYTLENYFERHKPSAEDPSGKAELEMVQLLIDNGALTTYGYSGDDVYISNSYGEKTENYHQPNALFSAAEWVCSDSLLTQDEVRLIQTIAASGADPSAENIGGKTAAAYFEESAAENGIEKGSENYDAIVSALTK